MDPQTAFKFIEEIRQQCRFGNLAWQHLRASLQSLDAEKTFFFVHAFLHHGLTVSRLLWPRRQTSAGRGATLRQALQIQDTSPLRLGEMATQITQPDEQFEDWLASLDQKNYVETNIMPRGSIDGFKQDVFHRDLDPENYRLTLRGTPCDLRQLADALRQLEATASSWLRTHQPW